MGAEFDSKKFAEFSGKGAGDKKAKAPKAEKKKEPEKKKEKKEEPEEDAFAAMEPKKKDPLDALPKGTFDLEEWKRFYSNNDEEPAIAWFWEHFDHENYSIWRGDCKKLVHQYWKWEGADDKGRPFNQGKILK